MFQEQKQYIEAKKRFRKDYLVASFFGVELDDNYFSRKREFLEKREYLSLDQLIVDKNVFNSFFQANNCYLLSKRANKQNLMWEIDRLGLNIKEEKVIVIGQEDNPSKIEFLEKESSQDFVLFGDSMEELNASKIPNSKIVLVRTGLETFEAETPNNCIVIDSLNEFFKERNLYGI